MEQYDIVKLKLFNTDRYLYVAILEQNLDIVKVKLLNQPAYVLVTSKYSNSIFEGYDPEYDYKEIPLNYENVTHTFNIHYDMMLHINDYELHKIMKHLLYTDFLDKDNVQYKLNKTIFSNALDNLHSF